MSYRWVLTAALVAAGMSATLTRAQTELSASPVAAKSHATRSAHFTSDSSAANSSAWLETIKVEPQSQGMRFEIKTSTAVKPIVTAVPDPNRLVIDFPNTVSAYAENHIPVDHDGVKAVRIGVQPVVPPVTRVVLDLDRPRNYQVASNGGTVTVNLDDAIAADYSPAESNSEPVTTTATSGKESVDENVPSPNPALHAASDPTGSPKTSSGNDIPSPASVAPGAANNTSSVAPKSEPARSNPPSQAANHPSVKVATSAFFTSEPASSNRATVQPATPDDPPGDAKASPVAAQPTSALPAAAAQSEHSSPAARQAPPTEIASTDLPSSQLSANQPAAQSPSDQYVIGEQDVLAITVWKEPELSGVVVVRPDGKITVPLVNEVQVVGLTPVQLQALLTEKLKPFVNVPQVTVTARQINSRNVYLIGEAAREGSFPINSSTTILQLIAQAGGLKDFAKRKKIYVIRKLGEKQARYSFNYDDVIRGKNTKQNIVLQPGDLVVVP
jgi:polysaccharide export outer membrane protein